MAGPLPPAIGGMATVIDDISRSSLVHDVELVLFDSGKRTPEGRSVWQAIKARFTLWRDWWQALHPSARTIAHIHTCSGLTYFLDGLYMLLARLRGVPVVMHVHGARFDAFLDGLSRPRLLLARFVARRAARVVVLSGEWQEKLSSRLPGARLTVIENGVAEAPVVAVEKPTGVITVLFLGNLCQRKGVWDLVACAPTLPSEVHLVFVGGEEDLGIMEELKARIRAEQLESRITLAGPAVGAAKFKWLRVADIFVLPSYAEGVPISMLEALAVGLPAVLTPVGGIPSVLRDGVHAVFVQPDDPAALAQAITRLAHDPILRMRLGEAARQHVLGNFGIERSAHKYLQLYGELRPDLFPSASAPAASARQA